jgi:rhodanese-related sulfurtransferase
MSELTGRMSELPQDRDIVLLCHAGIRSMQALQLLRDHAGLTRLKSLYHGIDAWSAHVDPSIPRY